MNDLAEIPRLARVSAELSVPAVLWPLAIVADAESMHYPDSGEAYRTLPGHAVLESLLPEVRLLACMFAAARHDWVQAPSPSRFTSPADWLAARMLVLQPSHVETTPEAWGIFEGALARVADFCGHHGLVRPVIVPVISGTRRPAGGPPMCLAWRQRPFAAPQIHGAVAHTLAVRAELAERLSTLRRAAGV